MALRDKLQALNDFEEVTDIFISLHNMEHHEEGSSYQEKKGCSLFRMDAT